MSSYFDPLAGPRILTEKFNPNHDPKDGKFAPAGGNGSKEKEAGWGIAHDGVQTDRTSHGGAPGRLTGGKITDGQKTIHGMPVASDVYEYEKARAARGGTAGIVIHPPVLTGEDPKNAKPGYKLPDAEERPKVMPAGLHWEEQKAKGVDEHGKKMPAQLLRDHAAFLDAVPEMGQKELQGHVDRFADHGREGFNWMGREKMDAVNAEWAKRRANPNTFHQYDAEGRQVSGDGTPHGGPPHPGVISSHEGLVTPDSLDDEDARPVVRHTPAAQQLSLAIPKDNQEEHLQRDAVASVVHRRGSNVSEVKKVSFEDGDIGMFKPSGGEAPHMRDNIKSGFSVERETTAYQLSKLVGDDLVPPTIERTINGERGSVQAFVKGRTGAEADPSDITDDTQWYKAGMFDYVVGNTDRHLGNIMIGDDEHLHLIDHNLAFPDDEKATKINRWQGAGAVMEANRRARNAAEDARTSIPEAAKPYIDKAKDIHDLMMHSGLSSGAIAGVDNRIARLKYVHGWGDLLEG